MAVLHCCHTCPACSCPFRISEDLLELLGNAVSCLRACRTPNGADWNGHGHAHAFLMRQTGTGLLPCTTPYFIRRLQQ